MAGMTLTGHDACGMRCDATASASASANASAGCVCGE